MTLSIDSFCPNDKDLFYLQLCETFKDNKVLVKNFMPKKVYGHINTIEQIIEFAGNTYNNLKLKIQANNNYLTCFTVSTKITNFKSIENAEKELHRKLFYFRKVLGIERLIISALVIQNSTDILKMQIFVMPIVSSNIFYRNQYGEYPKLVKRLCSREFDRLSIQEHTIALNNYKHKHQK